MKTIETINKEFDKKFVEDGRIHSKLGIYTTPQHIKEFIESTLTSHTESMLEMLAGMENSVPITTIPNEPWNRGYHDGWNAATKASIQAIKSSL